MNDNIINILKELEKLTDEELKKVGVWVDFNISKRKNISTKKIYV